MCIQPPKAPSPLPPPPPIKAPEIELGAEDGPSDIRQRRRRGRNQLRTGLQIGSQSSGLNVQE